MGHFSPSPHGRIKDLPGYQYGDVDFDTMLDVARGRRFKGFLKNAGIQRGNILFSEHDGFSVKGINNRRFMYNPKTSEILFSGSNIDKSSHAQEWYDVKVKGNFDDCVRGWIGWGGSYRNGVIHFAPPIVGANINTGFDALLMFKRHGASDKTIVRGFGERREQSMEEVLNPSQKMATNIMPMQIVKPWTDAYGNPVNPEQMQIPLRNRPDYGEIEMEIEKRMGRMSSMIISSFLTKEELDLPKEVHQIVNTRPELFKAAEEADTQMRIWLEGISKKLGLRHYHQIEYSMPQIDYEDKGSILITTPIKKIERSDEKVKSDYKGDWSLLLDVVRATIAIDAIDKIDEVMRVLRESGMVLARRPKDRFTNPADNGFRNIHLNIRLPNGHIGELQVHVKPMLKATEDTHKYYKVVREIEAEAEKTGKDLTTEEKVVVGEVKKLVSQKYNEAWVKAGGKLESGEEKTAGKTLKRQYLGVVDLSGDVHVVKLGDVTKEVHRDYFGFMNGDRFRYDDGYMEWTEEPSEDSMFAAQEWFINRGLPYHENVKYRKIATEKEGKSKVFLPPKEVENPDNLVSVFLAGSIDMGEAEDWQTEISKALKDTLCVIMNPRRDDWDSSWKQEITNDKFREQVEWELEGMENATLIAMCLTKDSKAPISLLELGLHAGDGKMIVCCPKGFWRKGNVDIVCKRYEVPVFEDFDEFEAEVVKRMQKPNIIKKSSRGWVIASDRLSKRISAREFVLGMWKINKKERML
jgi:hypothetical protein